MAQNPYLQNLLGINQGGMGLYNYNYSLPTYNTLLSKGLTEDQIKGYDTGFNTFNQFPYQAQPNPQLNFPQYGVVPQAPGVDPITTDPPPNGGNGNGGGGGGGNGDSSDVVSTAYGDFTSDDFTQDIYTYPSNKPMNQMTEQELMAFGEAKGYIDADGRLMGPMQNTLEGKGLYGSMLSKPAQIMNDKKYDWFLDSLNQKGMMQGGGTADSLSFAMHSPQYNATLAEASRLNTIRREDMKKIGFSDVEINKYMTSGDVKIPGTFKKVTNLVNQYAPSGRDDKIVYHTQTGGHYRPDGKFETGYGVVAAHGSMADAVDTLVAAANTGNTSTVPDKFNQAWVNKMTDPKTETVSKTQKESIEQAWKKIEKDSPKDKQDAREKKGKGPSRQQQRMKTSSQGKSKTKASSGAYGGTRKYGR